MKYKTKKYFEWDVNHKRLLEFQQELILTNKKGEPSVERLDSGSTQVIINANYQLDDEYGITSNMPVCKAITPPPFKTSFLLDVCEDKNGSKPIKKEKICDRYNDCDDCPCGCIGCDCTKGDESEKTCKGQVRMAFKISIACFFVILLLGCAAFWLVKIYTDDEKSEENQEMKSKKNENETDMKPDKGMNVKIDFKESYSDDNSTPPQITSKNDIKIEKDIIDKLNNIVRNGKGMENQFVLENLVNFRKMNKKRGATNCRSLNYLKILKLTYTLSHNLRYQRECNKIVYMLYLNEYDVHKNRAKALKCLMGSKKELSYLSSWIYKVVEQNGVFNENEEEDGEKASKFKSLKAQLPFYVSPMFTTGMVYLDITKDVATTFFFYHIYENILKSINFESRYESVGQLNFERLFWYHLGIIITSQVLIYLRVLWKGLIQGCYQKEGKDDLHKIFNTENTCLRFLVYVFPIHFCLLEQGFLNYKIHEAQQNIFRIDQVKKKNDDDVSHQIMKTSKKLEDFNRRLHYINQLYAEIDILETCFERSPQLVIQTVLFITANYYSRVLYLFDELLFIPITYVFVLNWFLTVHSITNSILRYRNAKRFPMSSALVGTILQRFALFILISAKILFISAAVANMPYFHPIGPILEITIVFLFHLIFTRCRPSKALYTTVGIATTPAFYRPPSKKSKTLQKKIPMMNNPDLQIPLNETEDKQDLEMSSYKDLSEASELKEEQQLSTEHYANSSGEKNESNKCQMFFGPYMSLRSNGGILSNAMLEVLSITIYFGIGKLVRYIRKHLHEEIDENKILAELKKEGKEVQKLFLPLVKLILIDVDIVAIVIVIAVLLGTFILYLGLVRLYYKYGHPKHLIINNINENEPEEKISRQLHAQLDWSSTTNTNIDKYEVNQGDEGHQKIMKTSGTNTNSLDIKLLVEKNEEGTLPDISKNCAKSSSATNNKRQVEEEIEEEDDKDENGHNKLFKNRDGANNVSKYHIKDLVNYMHF